MPSLDWSKPLETWSRNEIIEFLTNAVTLARRAVAARNAAEEQIADKPEAVDALLDTIVPF
jgi:hypothetical protein